MIATEAQFKEFKRLYEEAKTVALDHEEFLQLVFNSATEAAKVDDLMKALEGARSAYRQLTAKTEEMKSADRALDAALTTGQ